MTIVEHTLEQIRRSSGLVFTDVRLHAAGDVITRWLGENQVTSSDQVHPGPQLDQLIEQIVIHESYFDRDLDQLRMIDELVFKPREHSGIGLDVWSAGCANGEEAYTIAFMLETRGLLARASFVATDISQLAIRRARTARYRAWSLRTGDRTPAMRYLVRDGAELAVPDAIKKRVDVRTLNLLEDEYPAHQDLILCRNVLIYLSPDAIAKIAPKLARALKPDGWLFVAPSDPRLDVHAALEATVTDRGVYYRRPRTPVAALPKPKAPVPLVRPRPPRITAPPPRVESARANRLADRGDYEAARRVLAESLRATPLDPELHFLSAILAADDDQDGSLAALGRAIYLAPEIPSSYLFAGRIHQARGDIVQAQRAFQTALDLLERLPADALIPWADEPARLVTAACRQALESLDGR